MPNGADVLVEGLVRWGVRHLFGMPGSHSTTIYDALARSGSIRTILIRNEQAGAFAADGSARVTGEPGVVCTTAGPGATNALSGVAECWADSIPILLLAGQVNSDAMDRECGNYHEIDLEGIFRPATAWCGTVRRVDRIPAMLGRAFQAMTWGRPRPAALFLPQDLMRAPWEDSAGWPSFPPRPTRRAGGCDRTGRRAPGERESTGHPGGWRSALVGCGRGDRRTGPAARLAGDHHAQRQGPSGRAPPTLTRSRPVGPSEGRPSARRRHAGRRLPIHRGAHGLETAADPEPADPDRPRTGPDRHESPGGRRDRGRCQAAAAPSLRRWQSSSPQGSGWGTLWDEARAARIPDPSG